MSEKTNEIRLSYRCNNNCRFCEIADERERYMEPSLQEVKNGLAADREYEIAEFFGGEPTISPYFLNVLKLVTEQGRKSKINTNCRMFYYKEFTKKVMQQKIWQIITSVESHEPGVHDYLTRTRGSFRQTVEGIKNLRAEGFEVHTTTIMMEQNIRDLQKIADFMIDELGVTTMRYSFLQTRGNALKNREVIPRLSEVREHLPRLIEHVQQRGANIIVDQGPICAAGGHHDAIEALEYTSKGNRRLEDLFIKTERCKPCRAHKICPGACRGYIEMFGDSELMPLREKQDLGPKP